MSEKVNLNVNGIEIESDPNKLLIEACEDSGIHIPRFCWHKRLDPVGMCRIGCALNSYVAYGEALPLARQAAKAGDHGARHAHGPAVHCHV